MGLGSKYSNMSWSSSSLSKCWGLNTHQCHHHCPMHFKCSRATHKGLVILLWVAHQLYPDDRAKIMSPQAAPSHRLCWSSWEELTCPIGLTLYPIGPPKTFKAVDFKWYFEGYKQDRSMLLWVAHQLYPDDTIAWVKNNVSQAAPSHRLCCLIELRRANLPNWSMPTQLPQLVLRKPFQSSWWMSSPATSDWIIPTNTKWDQIWNETWNRNVI